MISLGLDPSLTGFGWVVHNPSVVGAGRVLARGVYATTKSEAFVKRYSALRSLICSILAAYPEIQAVGVESPPYGEQFSEGLYALFVYVNEALYLARRDVVYFDPLTVKLMAKMDPKVRRGTMDKGDMIEAARADTGVKKWNHNEADAYIIARSAARFWQYESGVITADELVVSEKHSFHRVHTYSRGAKAGQVEQRGLVFRENDRFFRFSQVPPDPGEEKLVQFLCQRSPVTITRQP